MWKIIPVSHHPALRVHDLVRRLARKSQDLGSGATEGPERREADVAVITDGHLIALEPIAMSIEHGQKHFPGKWALNE